MNSTLVREWRSRKRGGVEVKEKRWWSERVFGMKVEREIKGT